MRLHNTLTGNLEVLQTLTPDVVKLYTCGLTVYSQPHIGNWLGYIYWDVLIRSLKAEGYTVERTQNVTDVGHLTSDDDNGEDKMEQGAKREGVTAWDVASKYSEIAEHEGYELLRLLRPDHLVPATSLIDEQIEFAKALDEKEYLYEIPCDGMYFDTAKLSDYGKLAKLDIGGLKAGARVAVDGKKHITDFAVWKFSPKNTSRDMEWDSPWGVGFPGWHLECSVIARETLGDQIDIHTGGIDHIPVHHTNEIAQTEAVTGKQFATTWIHNNHIKINGTKISKSIGNVVTLQDIVDRGISLDAFKILAYSKHYRTEGNFDWDILDASNNRLKNWLRVAALRHQIHDTILADEDKQGNLIAAPSMLKQALQNDLGTPEALATIDQVFSQVELSSLQKLSQHYFEAFLESIDELLGIDLLSLTPDISDEAKKLLIERTRAREEKDWQESDRIRDELQSEGIGVNDSLSGTSWFYN